MRSRPKPPSIDDLAALHRVDVGPVPAEHIDGNGHLSVRFIVELAAHGAHELLVACGLTDERRDRTRRGVFTAEHHIAYLAEMRGDSELTVRVRMLDHSARAVGMAGFVVDEATSRLTAVLRTVVVSVDLESRRSVDFAPDVADAIEEVLRRHDRLPWSAPYPSWGSIPGARRRGMQRRLLRLVRRSADHEFSQSDDR